MNFAPLENILQRPEQPSEVGESNAWNAIEVQMRTKLPEDYKSFIRSFGTGSINEFLYVLNPFAANQYVNLLKRGQVEREAFQSSKTNFPQYYTDEIFPKPEGLLPFGVTDNGEVLYWRTIGEPAEWTVTVYESRGPKHRNHQTNLTGFLCGVLSRAMVCEVLPQSFTKGVPSFKTLKASAR